VSACGYVKGGGYVGALAQLALGYRFLAGEGVEQSCRNAASFYRPLALQAERAASLAAEPKLGPTEADFPFGQGPPGAVKRPCRFR
jgi:TPR repeat protein